MIGLCLSLFAGINAVRADESDGVRALGLADSAWTATASHYDLDPLLLYAIALGETRVRWSDGQIRPSPWCLRVAGVAHHPASLDEALKILRDAQRAGRQVQDVGLMQIYAPIHSGRVRDLAYLLDPSTSLTLAGSILDEALRSSPDVMLGIGHYHSWEEPRARAYGQNIYKMWQALRRQAGLPASANPRRK